MYSNICIHTPIYKSKRLRWPPVGTEQHPIVVWVVREVGMHNLACQQGQGGSDWGVNSFEIFWHFIGSHIF